MAKTKRSNNEGTKVLWHAPSKRYYAQVSIGAGKRKTIYGKTKKAVIRKRTLLLAQVARGAIAQPNQFTLGEWLRRWLEQKKPHISPRTYELYGDTIRLYVPEELMRMKLQVIKRAHLKELETNLAKRNLSASTRSKVFQHLRSAFNEAIEHEILMVNPAQGIRVKKTMAEAVESGAEKALTLDEMYRFLDAAEGDPFYPLFYLMFSLGLRRGEALGLRWRDVDFMKGTVRVVQQVKLEGGKAVTGPLKTRSSRRMLWASQDLLEVLKERREIQRRHRAFLGPDWEGSDLVFTTEVGTLIHPRNVNRSIKRIAKKAGVRHFASHGARHTNLTHRLRGGEKLEVVSKIAGHSRPSITHDRYRTVFEDELRSAVFSLAEKRNDESDS